jgi:diguanylate cyclase
LSLTLLDLDHFKALNDRWGHQAGDKALQAVASKIQALLRATDLVARYGGEEFVILMPSTTGQEALVAADKLRRELAGGAYHFRGTPIRLTVSCGVSEFVSGDTPDSVLRRADEALYLAKREGRNQCRMDPGTPQHSAQAFGHSALS